MDKPRESTGFRVGREMLYVGDMVSVDGGNDGFMKVVKRADGYWLEDCSKQVSGQAIPDRDFKLEYNLPYRYQVADPNDPYAEPQIKIYCSQCDEIVTGEMDMETGEITWNESCAVNEMVGDHIKSTCQLCAADPIRIKEKQQQRKEINAYFLAKKQELGIDKYNVMDLWSYFGSKEEIDTWFAVNEEQVKQLVEMITYQFAQYQEKRG